MKRRTRGSESANKNDGKMEPIVIKVRKMRGGKAHLIEEPEEEMVELTLQSTIQQQ